MQKNSDSGVNANASANANAKNVKVEYEPSIERSTSTRVQRSTGTPIAQAKTKTPLKNTTSSKEEKDSIDWVNIQAEIAERVEQLGAFQCELSNLFDKHGTRVTSKSRNKLTNITKGVEEQYHALEHIHKLLSANRPLDYDDRCVDQVTDEGERIDYSFEIVMETLNFGVRRTSAQIMATVFSSQLQGLYKEESVLLVTSCINFFFKASTVEDLINMDLHRPTRHNAIETLTKDEDVFLGVLNMVADIMDDDNLLSLKVEKHVLPILCFLHNTDTETLVGHTLSPPKHFTKHFADGLMKLVSSLPNMHSYSWIELSLAFIYKWRFHSLCAIEQDGPKEQESSIPVFKHIVDALPPSFVESIEVLDPPLSNTVTRKLKCVKTYREDSAKTFLEWSRGYIMEFCMNTHVESFTCRGICKYIEHIVQIYLYMPIEYLCFTSTDSQYPNESIRAYFINRCTIT